MDRIIKVRWFSMQIQRSDVSSALTGKLLVASHARLGAKNRTLARRLMVHVGMVMSTHRYV